MADETTPRPKRKRGRPPKKKAEPVDVKEAINPPETPVTDAKEAIEVAYAHESKKRCERTMPGRWPAFLGKDAEKCDTLMKPNGTRDNGRIKRWVCESCGHHTETEGKPV